MMYWLIVIILAYLFFSLAFFGDKLVLAGPGSPKLYTFYIGFLNLLVIFLIPFVDLGIPNAMGALWIVLDAIAFVLGLYTMFLALEKFDVSRVMTTLGAFQPILILVFTWIFFGSLITGMHFVAFILLFLGSIIVSLEKKFTVTINYLLLVLFSSLMFSLDYMFAKLVFLDQPFVQGLIWTRLAIFLIVLVFLFDKELRSLIFAKKVHLDKKTGGLLLFAQSSGAIAGFFQSLAISLVPISYLAILNSLRGIQYVFLFGLTLFFSIFLPHILKEDMSRKVIIQKIISIILIVLGLVLLAIY